MQAVDTTLTWSVDAIDGGNATVGTITSGGVYSAGTALGTHMVKATSVADPAQNASATVTVTPKPKLIITEVHSSGNTAGQDDWWELTNFDDRAHNLRGYRFDDDSQSLASAITITNDVTIAPGESVVLFENSSATNRLPAQFRNWWGGTNLRDDLQIIIYKGSGISLSGSNGDGLYVWNAAATVTAFQIMRIAVVMTTIQFTFAAFDKLSEKFATQDRHSNESE